MCIALRNGIVEPDLAIQVLERISWRGGGQAVWQAASVKNEMDMATYVIMAFAVALLAGFTGGMPGPMLRNPH